MSVFSQYYIYGNISGNYVSPFVNITYFLTYLENYASLSSILHIW